MRVRLNIGSLKIGDFLLVPLEETTPTSVPSKKDM